MKRFCIVSAALLGIVAWAAPGFAQTGILHGTVTDPSGAAVPGAKVTLIGAGPPKSATTDRLGAYVFSGIALGDYTVQAIAPGLALAAPAELTLQAGEQTLNFRLELAAMSEKVTVRENAGPTVSVDSSNNASALVLKGSDLDALSDDPDDLAADLQALAGPSAGPNGGSIFVDGFSGGELPRRNRFARSASTPIPSPRNTTSWVMARSKSLPSRDRTNIAARWITISQRISGIRAIHMPR